MYLTYKFRIKDSNSSKYLDEFASKVNYVWNYLNNLNKENYLNYKRGQNKTVFLSAFTMNNYTSGACKLLNLHSQTIQNISETYFSNKKIAKKSYLYFRSYKKNLGWIPMKALSFHLDELNSTITYQKKKFRYWNSRSLPQGASIKNASFNQDSRKRWYINITFKLKDKTEHYYPKTKVGIDLGVKEVMTLSDGTKFHRANVIKKYEDKLAKYQRAKKKKQIRNIYAKINNVRRDLYHEMTTKIAKQFSKVVIGRIRSRSIINNNNLRNLTKGVYDASWYLIKEMLRYKVEKYGGEYKEVSERYTTRICFDCKANSGPRGSKGLKVRKWMCSNCHAKHDRDVNSAKNILARG